MAFKNHFFHRIQTIHFFSLPTHFQPSTKIYTRTPRKETGTNERGKKKQNRRKEKEKRNKKKIDAFLDPAVVTKIGADDSVGHHGVRRTGGVEEDGATDATGSRWFQPRTAGFPLTRSAARARRLFRVELAGLSLNRDLQPAPRSTAAWTIRDLFTAETVSSNRSSRLLNIKPRLGLFHATWIR